MGRKSKKKGGGGGGAPDWMVTYGDLMSLLLCFFVMLVSMSSIQEAKFKLALGSLMGALGVMHYETSVVDLEHLPKTERYDEEVERILDEFNEFQEQIEEEGLEETIEVIETDEGMLIRMANPLLFESGKAELKKSGIDILTSLASVLLEFDSQVRIEGHTDNVAINNEEFPSNWELSARRAVNVLRHLNACGIPGEKLSAVGRGEYRPLVDNDTPENRAQNRRVEIYVDYKDELEKKRVRGYFAEEESNGG